MINILAIATMLPIMLVNSSTIDFPSKEVQEEIVPVKKLDNRAQILRAYFAKYNSPLQDFAEDFIEAADKYDVDWKLVPSIAGVESTFGKFTPSGNQYSTASYNGWGWGVYGTQAIYFKSWRDGIFTVTQGLREKYIDRGYKNPYQMNRIYATSPVWGSKVSYFMQDLEKFAGEYSDSPEFDSFDAKNDIEQKTSESSAKIVGSL